MSVSDLEREIEGLRRENDALRGRAERAEASNEALEERATELLQDLDRKRARLAQLEARIADLLQRTFGRRSEKFHPDQLALHFSECAAEISPPHADEAPDDEKGLEKAREGRKKKRKKPRRTGRIEPPADARRERIVHEPAPEELLCPCCSGPRKKIGEEVSEETEFQPATLFIREHVRPKYACPRCPDEGVKTADLPPRPIDRGKAGPGLLAHIVTSKYADHLPLYRLEGIFGRTGWTVPRSTMCDWIAETAFLLQPIVQEMRSSVLASYVIQADDTRVRMQKNWMQGGIRNCHLWAYVGDKGDVVYDFTLTRAGSGPAEFLRPYKGNLQADAFSGFDGVYRGGWIEEVGCWAHGRRGFVKAMSSDPRNASMAIGMIRALYKVEEEAKEVGADLDEILRMRQNRSAPLLDAFEEWVDEMRESRPLQKDALSEALGYVHNQRQALRRFVHDPRLSIDNNACERALRAVAVGRKNWLFAGSEEGGKRAAILYSIIETCRLNAVNPFEYLRDVLDRVSTHPSSRVAELTPRGWKAARTPAAAPVV